MREHAYHNFSLHYLDHQVECGFGPLRLRVPPQAKPRMSDPGRRYSDAVFFDFPDGFVRLSVLAAPRAGGLWLERAEEVAAERAGLGDRVRSFSGEWGPELRIVDAHSINWVIGMEGPRWMLLGRSTCHLGADNDLSDTLRAMMGASAVVRGDEPLPVRTPLPLSDPTSLAGGEEAAPSVGNRYRDAVSLRIPQARAPIPGERLRAW